MSTWKLNLSIQRTDIYLFHSLRETEEGIGSVSRSANRIFDGLDLSYSANPLQDLALFSPVSLEEIKQVDISMSYFIGDEIPLFFQKITTLKPDIIVIFSSNQKTADVIKQIATQYSSIKLYERCDTNDDECPIFSPSEAKELGVFKKPRMAIK